MDFKKRLGNYGLWVAIFALIPLIVQAFGANILPDNYNEISAAILGILVMLGVVNNPSTSNRGFFDDKQSSDTPKSE